MAPPFDPVTPGGSFEALARYGLRPGDSFSGPALVEEDETTTVVGPGASLDYTALLLTLFVPGLAMLLPRAFMR